MFIIFAIIAFIFIIVLVISPFMANFIYKKIFNHRNEKEKYLKYFTPEELELTKEAIEFVSDKKQIIKGYIYCMNKETYKGVVVFSHGMGGPHLAYIKEIQFFAKLGFLVIGYDNTGHGESQGHMIYGFQQGIIDLNYLLDYLKTRKDLENYPIILCGHSWGAYSVSNANLEDVSMVISLSSFNHPGNLLTKMVKRIIRFPFTFLEEYFTHYEKKRFGNCKETLISLKESKIPFLIIHGKNDELVSVDDSFYLYKVKLSAKENINFYLVEDRFHRPLITEEAALYDYQVNINQKKLSNIKEKNKLEIAKKEFFENLDYELMTQFDEKILKIIEDFICENL